MRVIAGQYRSRILKSLKGLALRPTSDKLRETLFNVLAQEIAGSHFVDLFAGTGAVGIEALSRGAAEVVFIENHAPAAALIRKNLESLAIRSGATVLSSDALRGLQTMASRYATQPTFGYVFLDPPYAAADDYLRVLRYLGSAEFLTPNAIVIAEHRKTFPLPDQIENLHQVRLLKQGDAALTFYRRTPATSL
ncbi:MAG TPA: 16S rRNA (guanine(966)-N(2))-methyltransferase RsmD [Candidatus Dormibacteraeota bacterium]|nr:16S rRNA (guanine(966)-N(2))-methyltransferase RsmD [Candidatus Dormibacteraeota bacterium]